MFTLDKIYKGITLLYILKGLRFISSMKNRVIFIFSLFEGQGASHVFFRHFFPNYSCQLQAVLVYFLTCNASIKKFLLHIGGSC